MIFDKRHKNVTYSILLFSTIWAVIFNIKWDTDFASVGIILATNIISIFIGMFFIILKLFKVTISKTNFIYTYFGVLNLILPIFSLRIIILNKDYTIVLLLLIQLTIALIILIDIFKNKRLINRVK